MQSQPQYWVVGATWGGREDQSAKFLLRGIWFLGYDDREAPDQASLRDRMRPGDRIAIKRMMGQGATTVRIIALGIINDIEAIDKCTYVNWVVPKMERVVEARGCFKSVHGPFDPMDPWTRSVFLL